ncbi:MAG: (deoxy)nucleoside triphosphate pyrophosphohydrolase [Christensenellales bacterium]
MIEVVAALIMAGGSFLICQRPAHKQRGLLWEFPGGKLEAGESPQEALVRECQEELGVTLAVGPLYLRVAHRYPDIHIALSLYQAQILNGSPSLREHADLRWIRASQVDDYPFCPADVPILQRLKAEGLPRTT